MNRLLIAVGLLIMSQSMGAMDGAEKVLARLPELEKGIKAIELAAQRDEQSFKALCGDLQPYRAQPTIDNAVKLWEQARKEYHQKVANLNKAIDPLRELDRSMNRPTITPKLILLCGVGVAVAWGLWNYKKSY